MILPVTLQNQASSIFDRCFCSQEKFANCFSAMRDRNPAEFKSITEQLMEHLQNNIEVYFLGFKFCGALYIICTNQCAYLAHAVGK